MWSKRVRLLFQMGYLCQGDDFFDILLFKFGGIFRYMEL